jgi:hypothetical protein
MIFQKIVICINSELLSIIDFNYSLYIIKYPTISFIHNYDLQTILLIID